MPNAQNVMPPLRPDFRWDFEGDFKELQDFDEGANLSSPLPQPPRRPPPMGQDITEAIRRSGKVGDKVLHDASVTDAGIESRTQIWQQHLALGTEKKLIQTRMADLDEVEHRAQRQAAENALAAKRLQRREAEISAVEKRARITMADIAKQNLRSNRREAELQHREDLSLAREQDGRRKSTIALQSHAAVVEKEKRLDRQLNNTREAIRLQERDQVEREKESHDELARMREEARWELVKRREDADQILMEKIRKLEEQRETNRQDLSTHLGDPGAYLEKARDELADREAEFAVQVARRDTQLAAREQEFADWEDGLFAQQQVQLADRMELLRCRDAAKKRIHLLDVQAEMLRRKELATMVESVFTRWRSLSLEALVQMKLSSIDYPYEPNEDMGLLNRASEEPGPHDRGTYQAGKPLASEGAGHHNRGTHQVRKPVAWIVNPMNSAAKRDDEHERRQDYLESLAQQEQGIIRSSIFFIWRGVVLKHQRAQQSRRRAENVALSREELPKGLAWEVKGLQTKKWEREQDKEVMETRQDDNDKHALHTVFFLWKHLLRDPRKAFGDQVTLKPVDQDLGNPVAWSIETTSWPPVAHVPDVPIASASHALEQRKCRQEQALGLSSNDDYIEPPSPRMVGFRGVPFNYDREPGTSKLKVVRLGAPEPDSAKAHPSKGSRVSQGRMDTPDMDATLALTHEDGRDSQGMLSAIGLDNAAAQRKGSTPIQGRLSTSNLDTTLAQTCESSRFSRGSHESHGNASHLSSLSRGSRSNKNGGSQAGEAHPSAASRGSRNDSTQSIAWAVAF